MLLKQQNLKTKRRMQTINKTTVLKIEICTIYINEEQHLNIQM